MDPIEFIQSGEDGTSFVLNETAIELLQTVKKPLVVVSVVGMYRTGKSYLLNRLMGRSDGFPLGATVQAKTKGIWMWLGDHPLDPENKALLLLDTEGLHDPEKGSKTHDTWIFTLAVLLSSVLIYNSKGTVDANALDGLYLASQLTEHVTVKNGNAEETGEEFGRLFPILVWALRDHHLQLEVDGKNLQPSEYLDHCLKLKRGKGEAIAKYNDLRSSIKEFFIERHLICFPVPCQMKNLKDLDKLQVEDLDPAFVKVGNEFTDFILNQVREKTLGGKSVNGSMFAELSKHYIDAIGKGSVNIESSFDFVLKAENSKAVKAAIDRYQAILDNQEYPLFLDELTEQCKNAEDEANRVFLQSAILTTEDGRSFSKKLSEQIIVIQKSVAEKNSKQSEDNSMQILQKLYEPIEAMMINGEFTRTGGSKEYSIILESLEKDFHGKEHGTKRGPRGDRMLADFLKGKRENELKSLVQTDEALSEKEKEAKILDQEKKQIELQKKAQEEEIMQMKAAQEQITQNFNKNLEKQKEEFSKQHEEEKETMKKQFDTLLKLQQETMEAGFKEEAELLKEQVEDTRRRMEEKENESAKAAEMMEKMFEQMQEQNKENMKMMEKLASRPVNVPSRKKCVIS
eukprot:GFUD01012167.1.p1 GENE.GFUD01012167.1~~GFUD01012167.1.p1  ORF type:complete len:628 (+),score=187.88 GFUD01012167.1:82-1965(+)